MNQYRNREAAGRLLAQELKPYAKRADTLILALPRGGVPVAFEIAQALQAPLDVFVVRKLGIPGQEELAMGAIAMGGYSVLNAGIIRDLKISTATLRQVIALEEKELERRVTAYRGTKAFPVLKGRTVILVDDGIATGATMRAAITALKKASPAYLIVAAPVAEKSICEKLAAHVDRMVCPLRPLDFHAVGSWYQEFDQTSDEEVRALLQAARAQKA